MYDLLFLCAVQITEGYSGSDLRLVCKEAAMRPVRKIFDILESTSSGEHFYPLPIVSPQKKEKKKEEKKEDDCNRTFNINIIQNCKLI